MDTEAARLEGWFEGLTTTSVAAHEPRGWRAGVLAHLGIGESTSGLLRRGHPGLHGALHVEGGDGHEQLQCLGVSERADRPGELLEERRGALEPLGAAGGATARHGDGGQGRIWLDGRPGTWPASWPPTPTTSGCPRQPPRPTAGGVAAGFRPLRPRRGVAGGDGGARPAASPWRRRHQVTLDDAGSSTRSTAGSCSTSLRSGPAANPERPGMTPKAGAVTGDRRSTARRPTATASRRSTMTCTRPRPRPTRSSTCWPSRRLAARPWSSASAPAGSPSRWRRAVSPCSASMPPTPGRSCAPSRAGGDRRGHRRLLRRPRGSPCQLIYVVFNTFFALPRPGGPAARLRPRRRAAHRRPLPD